MVGLLVVLLLAAIVGIVRPYIGGAKRWHFAVAAAVIFFSIGVVAPKSDKVADKPKVADAPATMPAKPFLSVEPKVLDAHRVQLTIGTNLPMPIKVATSIDLHGQKGTDTYI